MYRAKHRRPEGDIKVDINKSLLEDLTTKMASRFMVIPEAFLNDSVADTAPNLVHQLIWGRFVNTHGGKGLNIPCDLHNEHVNKLYKEIIGNTGAKFASTRAARAVSSLERLSLGFERQTGIHQGETAHSRRSDATDVQIVAEVVLKGRILEIELIEISDEVDRKQQSNIQLLNEEQTKKLQEGLQLLSSALSFQAGPSSRQNDETVTSPSCGSALQTLRSIRRNYASPASRREQRSNFAPYSAQHEQKKKPPKHHSWTTRFVCLSLTTDDKVPCNAAMKETLLEAGLGEKILCIPNISCSKEEFNKIVLDTFPKLKQAGGYEFLRCVSNTKQLQVISTKVAQSPKFLKTIVGNGRVFIRPIQQDISLSPEQDTCSSPEMEDIENEMLDYALELSVNDNQQMVYINDGENTLQRIMSRLQSSINMEDSCTITVRRSHVLSDTLRAVSRPSFDVQNSIKVDFLGEEGIDGGGLKRELFSILGKEIFSSLFDGGFLRHDVIALQANKFFHIGKLIAMGVVHTACAFPFFASAAFKYMSGCSLSSIEVPSEEVACDEAQQLLKENKSKTSLKSSSLLLEATKE
eukprot:Em0018g519a